MQLTRNLQSILTFIVVLATLSMSACSMRIVYNYLDWIIPFYIDDYMTLTDHQEKLFDRDIIQIIRWHRAEELPKYERFIVTLKEAQTSPMSQQQVFFFFEDAEALWTGLLTAVMPALLELSTTLNEKQIQEINYALVDDIKNSQDKYGKQNDIERRVFLRDKINDIMDERLDRVTDEQAEMIELWSATRKNTTDDWLIYRNNWRLKLMELLNNRQASNYSDDMSNFLLNPKSIYHASYRRDVLENRRHFAQLLADLSTTFTARQREHLQHELAGIVDDLRSLRNQ